MTESVLLTQVVTTAFNDGDELVDYVRCHNDFDIVMTDIQMPRLNGLEATKQIRAFESEKNLKPKPIISFSANSFAEDRQKALDAGCDDTLNKPVKKDKLINKILKWTKLNTENAA